MDTKEYLHRWSVTEVMLFVSYVIHVNGKLNLDRAILRYLVNNIIGILVLLQVYDIDT